MDKNLLGYKFSIGGRQYQVIGHHYARPDLLVVRDITELWEPEMLFLPQDYTKQRLFQSDWTLRGDGSPDLKHAVPPVYDVDRSCVEAFRSGVHPNNWVLEVNNRSLPFIIEKVLPTDLVIRSGCLEPGCLELFSEAVTRRYRKHWADWQKEYVLSLRWLGRKEE